MRRVAIVGGGRWARVVAGVLLDLTPPETLIDLHSSRATTDLLDWIAAAGAGRIRHHTTPIGTNRDGPDAAVIVNAPHDHPRAAADALQAGVATLVEKPLATSAGAAAALVRLAQERGVFLGVSRVFLFARYIEAFAREVSARGPVIEGRLVWADPAAEVRYGMPKRVDPGLPMAGDVLPHVLPIIGCVGSAGPARIDLADVAVSRGGLQTDLRFSAGGAAWHVSLRRRAPARQRIIAVDTEGGRVGLDASQEPGVLAAGGVERSGDPDWETQPRPLASMLGAFLRAAGGAPADPRLDAATAVEEIRIADRALDAYRSAQAGWLKARTGQPIDDEIRYALSEIAAMERHHGA